MYLAVAGKARRGLEETFRARCKNDILKEYIAQKEYIYPPEPSLRLVIDTFEFAVQHTPKFNPISVSGYHIREAGSNAIQEHRRITSARRHGIRRIRNAPRAGRWINSSRSSPSSLPAHNDFFDARSPSNRAARRIWHKAMVERYHVEEPAHVGAALPHPGRRAAH